MKSQKIKFLMILIIVLCHHTIMGQSPMPIIKANSKNVVIHDGLNIKDNYWVIFPETKPDVYIIDLPRKDTKVKFITDIDSISFDMTYGEKRDFIILLNGKDSCYTQVSANYSNLVTSKKTKLGNDTIPFTMKDNRIYFKGKINGSDPINIQFDLGAGAMNISHRAHKKVDIYFDKKGFLSNSNGINDVRLSSANQVEISCITWQGIEIYETKNMDKYEDAIIGNSFFLDQIYKIDYLRKEIVIFSEPPLIESEYVKGDMILDGGIRPVFKTKFVFGIEKYEDWFLFDTGNTSTGIVGSTFLQKNDLYDKFSTILSTRSTKFVRMPTIIIGNRMFDKGTITLEKPSKKGSRYKYSGIIGNSILNQFNVIIDNRNGYIYLDDVL